MGWSGVILDPGATPPLLGSSVEEHSQTKNMELALAKERVKRVTYDRYKDDFSWDLVPVFMWNLIYSNRTNETRYKLFNFLWYNGMKPDTAVSYLISTEDAMFKTVKRESVYHYNYLKNMTSTMTGKKMLLKFWTYDIELKRWRKGEWV